MRRTVQYTSAVVQCKGQLIVDVDIQQYNSTVRLYTIPKGIQLCFSGEKTLGWREWQHRFVEARRGLQVLRGRPYERQGCPAGVHNGAVQTRQVQSSTVSIEHKTVQTARSILWKIGVSLCAWSREDSIQSKTIYACYVHFNAGTATRGQAIAMLSGVDTTVCYIAQCNTQRRHSFSTAVPVKYQPVHHHSTVLLLYCSYYSRNRLTHG